MNARLALLSSLSLVALGAAPALAQSGPPGMCDCAVPAPAPAPVAAPTEGWDGSRWGIGLRLSSTSFHEEDRPEEPTNFGGGGIELGYRLNARWEFSLAVGGGREKLEDGSDGSLELGQATLAASYHLRPYRAWDVFVSAGFGSTTITTVDATERMREDATRGHFQLGVGIERRLRRWPIGLSAELHAIGVAPREEAEDVPTTTDPRGNPVPPTMPELASEDEGLSGGELTLGATYYF